MLAWFILVSFSALVGFGCTFLFSGKLGAVAAAAIPWAGLLAWLLYSEYFVPYQDGGASMWPIAQLFAGSIAALVGVTAYLVSKRARPRVG